MNLRDSIEDERDLAEKATDEKQKRIHASKGKNNAFPFFILVLNRPRDAQFTALL